MGDIKKFIEEKAVDEGFLHDWYINSVMDDEPVWTESHIAEMHGDFYLIPKESVETLEDDFCEWKRKSNQHAYSSYTQQCNGHKHEIEMNDGAIRRFGFCPYCSKKIKVV